LIDVNPDAVAAQAARFRREGLDVRSAVADVTDHAALDAVIDQAAAEYGRLDVVFANAGIDPGVGFLGAAIGAAPTRVEAGALERYSDDRWNRVININLNGIFATARAAARHRRPRRSGRIILTTSIAATSPRHRALIAAIVEARQATGLSQREFAKKLRRTNNFVWRIEAGERKVEVLEFIEIAKAAGIEPDELMRRVMR
jgi:NAD(P)-dependent dehydrogenase (short-subunit alcohol dehydrogenase family)